MNLLVDTNILLYAANGPAPEHPRAFAFLDSLRNGSPGFCLTWPICYEFLRVSTHPRVFPSPLTTPEALDFLHSLWDLPHCFLLSPTERHVECLGMVLAGLSSPAGNIFHDIGSAVLCFEHGVPEVATADTDFHRFRFLKVTNPLLG